MDDFKDLNGLNGFNGLPLTVLPLLRLEQVDVGWVEEQVNSTTHPAFFLSVQHQHIADSGAQVIEEFPTERLDGLNLALERG